MKLLQWSKTISFISMLISTILLIAWCYEVYSSEIGAVIYIICACLPPMGAVLISGLWMYRLFRRKKVRNLNDMDSGPYWGILIFLISCLIPAFIVWYLSIGFSTDHKHLLLQSHAFDVYAWLIMVIFTSIGLSSAAIDLDRVGKGYVASIALASIVFSFLYASSAIVGLNCLLDFSEPDRSKYALSNFEGVGLNRAKTYIIEIDHANPSLRKVHFSWDDVPMMLAPTRMAFGDSVTVEIRDGLFGMPWAIVRPEWDTNTKLKSQGATDYVIIMALGAVALISYVVIVLLINRCSIVRENVMRL